MPTSQHMPRDSALERAAAQLYDASLPYHNFEHARTVLQAAESILQQCELEGVPVNAEVVYYALLFHDAGYHEDHERLGFPTKEALSADLARKALNAHGAPSELVAAVADAISATERDTPAVTNEQRAVRAADLMGLSADYDTFRKHTEDLWREHAQLYDEQVEWDEWARRAADAVEGYIRHSIALTRYFRPGPDGRSDFQRKVDANITRLLGG